MQDWKAAFVEKAKSMEMDMVSFNDNHPCGGSSVSRALETSLLEFIKEVEKEMSKEWKIGDEVRVTTDAYHNSCPRGSLGMVVEVGQGFIGAAFNGAYGNDGYPIRLEDGEYEPTVSEDTPKLWRDMSDEEKL